MTRPANTSAFEPTRENVAIVGAKEAAKLLSISVSTLYRQLPEMPSRVRLSRARFGWKVVDLMSWIEARREAA